VQSLAKEFKDIENEVERINRSIEELQSSESKLCKKLIDLENVEEELRSNLSEKKKHAQQQFKFKR